MHGRLIAMPHTEPKPESIIETGENKSEGLVSSVVLVVADAHETNLSPIKVGDIIFHQPYHAVALPNREDGAFVIQEAQIDCYESI